LPAAAVVDAAAGVDHSLPKKGTKWPSFPLFGKCKGHLVHNSKEGSLAAHCPVHKLCRIQKKLRKEPMGYLLAWLEDAADYLPTNPPYCDAPDPMVASMKAHMLHRGDLLSDAPAVVAKRASARADGFHSISLGSELAKAFEIEALAAGVDVVVEPNKIPKN
jgi:hypothetical protein